MDIFRNSLNNEKHFFRLSLLIVIISFLLDIYYKVFIVANYETFRFDYDMNIFKYGLAKTGLLLLLFVGYFIFHRSLLLYAIYMLLIFFFYIPNSVLFSLSDASYKPFLSNLFFCGIFYFSTLVDVKIPSVKIKTKTTDWILIVLSLIFILPIVFAFRSNMVFNTLLLKDIYSTRTVFSTQISGGMNYLYHLAVKTILPVSMIYFLIRKKTFIVILYVIMLLYLYVISGNKIVYFYSFIIILFYFFHSDNVKKLYYYLVLIIAALLMLPLLDAIFLDSPILTGTFVNRFLFIPSLLTQWYFDFFDGKPFYFAESHVFNHYVKSPYDLPVGFMISKVYLHASDTYANNGVVSDGFMNLGYAGVLLFSFVVAGLFGLIKSLRLNTGYFGIYFGYVYMLLSAPLLSCFITGGIALFLLIAVFLLNSKKEITA